MLCIDVADLPFYIAITCVSGYVCSMMLTDVADRRSVVVCLQTVPGESLRRVCGVLFQFSVMTYTQTVELTHGLPFRLYPVVTNDGR